MARLLLSLLFIVGVANAQVQFTATASSTSVQVGENIEVTFTFTGAATGVPTPLPTDLTNLDLVGGPSTSTQTSIVNGQVSSQKSFTYYFRAKTPGKAVIGPVQANIRGRNYTTSPIQISVAAGEKARSGQREEVFIQVLPDKREAYVGEQIVLTYKLYFSTSVYSPEFKEMPKSPGFWTEEFDMPSQLVPRDEVVDGQSYKSVVVRKVALFATTAGDLTVEPLTAVVQVERRQNSRGRANDPFNDPFFSIGRRREAVEVSCRTLNLSIKPLPESGKPIGDLAVGKFSLSSRLDKSECETNDAITLTILVRGTGNIKTIPRPQVTISPDFEAFDPKTSDQIKRGPDRISGSKTFEYVLIPRASGTQVIPEIRLPYFDPDAGSYEVARTAPLTLNVAHGSARVSEGSMPVASKREVQTIGQDISYVKNSIGDLTSAADLPHQSLSFWVGLGAPWIALAGVMFAVRRQVRAGQTLSARRRRVLKNARAALLTAEKANSENKTEVVMRSLSTLVQVIAVEWTGNPAPTATLQDWEAEWRTRGYSIDHWDVFENANQLSERSRFAGSSLSQSELSQTIANVRRVLTELEGEVM
ncbi:MAG: protein BatD [bacterium]|nr:protein BatD [bacterium]